MKIIGLHTDLLNKKLWDVTQQPVYHQVFQVILMDAKF